MNEYKGTIIKREGNKNILAKWFEQFFLLGGWIVVLAASLAACAAIRTLLNY